MASYRDCAKKLGIEDQVDKYLSGDLDIDDEVLRQLGDAKREAMLKKYRADIDAIAVNEIKSRIMDYKGLNGERNILEGAVTYLDMGDIRTGTSSVSQHQAAVRRYYLGRLSDTIESAEGRKWHQRLRGTGAIADDDFSRNVVRGLFDEAIDDVDARKAAKIISETLEDIRKQFNIEGGFIRKLKDWGLPQRHVKAKIGAVPAEKWVDDIVPLLDLERMGLDNVNDARIVMREVRETIMTDGANKLDVADLPATGRSSVANRHREHRALHFKNADAWFEYQKAYGDGDIFGSVIEHVTGMSNELGLLQKMGTNPDARFQDMKRMVKHELDMAKSATGKNESWRSINRLDHVWGNISGLGVGSNKVANVGSTIRTVGSSAKLGGAFVSSVLVDPLSIVSHQVFNGMSMTRAGKHMLKQLTHKVVRSNTSRQDAARLGQIQAAAIDDFMGHARFTDPEITKAAKTLSTVTYKASLLTPWDRAMKTTIRMSILDELSRLPRNLDELGTSGRPGRMRRMLDNYGIDQATWREISGVRTTIDGVEWIDPMALPPELHGKLQGMIESEAGRGYLEPGARTRAVMNQGQQAGTLGGEFWRFLFQWKSFPIAQMQLRLTNMANVALGRHGDSAGFRIGYVGTQIAAMGVMGATTIQLKELTKGRDPLPLTTAGEWGSIFGAGLLQSGAGGLWYEAIYGMLAHGRSPGTLFAPPVVQAFDDIITKAVFFDIDDNQMESLDRELIERLGDTGVRALGWVPGQSLWYLRAMWEQVFVPWVAGNISEKELRRIENRNRRLERDRGQGRWISGEEIRAPEFQF